MSVEDFFGTLDWLASIGKASVEVSTEQKKSQSR